ncbi:hypothetical protein C8J56DRAFT_936304 [Mycena floridula]|nr:hypothetical protein C8J56DRAFT_936304 [Mycena floridula]
MSELATRCKVCGFSEALEQILPAAEAPGHLQELLSSNNSPSETEQSQFYDLLEERIQLLHDLDNQIATARWNLEQLVQKQMLVGQEVEQYQSVLHPVRRLPDELLSEIFLSFIDENLEDEDLEEETSLDAGSTLWIIPRVCSRWRSLALSLSRLWSTVRIAPEDFDIDQAPFILGIQLHRAASHQLSISVFTRDPVDYGNSVLQTLFPTSPRWKDLLIIGPSSFYAVFSSLRGFLPSIQTLHLWMLSTEFDTHFVVPADNALVAYEFTPNLKHIHGNPYLLSKFILPFSNLVIYDCDHGPSFTCCSILALLVLLPNLEVLGTKCYINIAFDVDRGVHDHDNHQFIDLPFLHQFNSKRGIRQWGNLDDDLHSSNDCHLLRRLTLPALKKLNMVVHKSVAELRALLRRSRCFLDTLSLELHDVPDDDCIKLLLQLPSLVSFNLSCTDTLADKLIDKFIGDDSVTPALQSLTLEMDWQCGPEKLLQLQTLRPMLKKVEIVQKP